MNKVIEWFANIFASWNPDIVIFIISLFPILELRGGMIAATLFGVPYVKALIICIIANIIPIPFILLFINKIFEWMRKFKTAGRFVNWLETRTLKRVTIEDAMDADAVFSMLMGDEVEPRKNFIIENAHFAKNLDI